MLSFFKKKEPELKPQDYEPPKPKQTVTIDTKKYQRFCRNLMKAPRLSGLSNVEFYHYLKAFMFQFEKIIEKEVNRGSK